MKVMRDHKETLASILETMVMDPLSDWSQDAETKPVETLKGIKDRIGGKMRDLTNPKRVLSALAVEGHVSKLIIEATKPKHLAVMYPGWGSYW